ncbi:hypothetical protein J7T55_010470 [Diaporthe amygdali]|uniref:uncharacterized protein n=1 Tax=Phomopsis amygdali TaxID=1214568 RepID=UPI0022FF09DF|nr:uncharacterized protein J7T55_010470 [Diaporthe amygdali]KAJ0115647.1 hypothetical protein J7T55_010470 [Diaporthe amygdali]
MPCDKISDSNTRETLNETTSGPVAPSNTPGPYVEGMVLDLTINWTRDTPSEERVHLTVTKVFDVTMSPAMEVKWVSSTRETRTAVLKLFDRRYGEQSRGSSSAYHSPSVEACWQRYVQSGQAPSLFRYIEEMDMEEGEGVWDFFPFEDDEDTADTWETTAKKEGRLQYRALQRWRSEIRAYEHLEKLQGKCVPLFYGTTSFSLDPSRSDTDFFRVGGILVQRIDGFILDSLLDMTEASPDTDWQGLVQSAVEVAEEVNKCGVMNWDCKPRNMIVQMPSLQPFEIDFAQCSFREEYASEDEYNEAVRTCGNPVGFGGVVATRLNRVLRLGIKIKYGPWLGDVIEH